jgi:hypothetical protein
MSDIERNLRAVAEAIDWPVADVTQQVTTQLAQQRRKNRRVLPRLALVTTTVILVIAIVLLGTPWGRKAVADILGVAGITIGWGEPSEVAGVGMNLGEPIFLDEGADLVAFPVLIPDDGISGGPDAVYHGDVPVGGAIHMVWQSETGLPAAAGVGILYSQFQVTEAELFVKSLDTTVEVIELSVRGQRGFWIEGAPHYVVYRDASGALHEDAARLAGNVLAWEEGGVVTHRIETIHSLEETLRLADSLRPHD